MENSDLQKTQQISKRTEHIKLPVLIPLFSSILVLLVTFTLAIYHLQQENINKDLGERIKNTNKFFQDELAEDEKLLNSIIYLLKNDLKLQQLWLEGNRDALLEYSTPIFEKLRKDSRITHFYYIDVNQTCFLRVHNPPRYGDYIDRFTLNTACRNQKPSWGIELGIYGTFTLRSVHPWFVNDKLTGYIELGEEIEHIIPRLKDYLDVDLVFLIDKKFLTRENWEEGQRMMGRFENWDLLTDSVVIDSSITNIPPEFAKFIGLTHSRHSDRIISAKINGSTYHADFVDLRDAAGKSVGDILVIKNVSGELASLQALVAVVATLCLLVAATLISFFYIYITGIEKHLIETHSSLVTEIEKRKVVEAELQRHRDDLEEIVNKRTAELQDANTQLQLQIEQRAKAEKNLEKLNADLESTVSQLNRSNKQLRDFAHMASHDLKTPLRGIGTLAQWLLTDYYDKFDDEGRKQVNLLAKRAESMDKIINAILDYSTLVRNKSYDRKVGLNNLVKDIIVQIQPPQNIKVTVNGNLPFLICEEKHIHQVFYNLIDNAVRFMDKPDGRITIDCAEDQRFWKFSISDNGPGVDPKYNDRIFQIFQTLADTDEAKGTGAGLPIVKKIVELYDGKVWLESTPGQGSTFVFTWPVSSFAVPRQIPQPAVS